ncbi:inositol monophosphatase [Rhodobacteraceae bacterium]|nr:inositol monophosphatase [Paracoccaceae bacterium]
MILTQDIEVALIDTVRRVARAEIMPRFRALGPNDIQSKSAPDDLVTEADVRAEAAITAEVHKLLPKALVVGEEAVSADPSVLDGLRDADCAVIIDPVDGTWNFAKGLATFGVILAVTRRGETVFGLLYDPVLDDWVMARRGGGAWYCRPDVPPVRLNIGGDTPQDQAVGFVPLFLFPYETRVQLSGAIPGFRRIWSVRCSCHEYRLLAQGHADFCLSGTLNPWDHAAGALAVEEAGGAVGLLDGAPYMGGMSGSGCLVTARSAETLARTQETFGPLILPF